MVGIAKESNGLYYIQRPPLLKTGVPSLENDMFPSSCNSMYSQLWHYRLGHLLVDKLQRIDCIRIDLPSNKRFVCDTCHYAKQKRNSFPISTTSSSCCFELVHTDIWGPFSTASFSGDYYFLTIVDDYSRYTWLHLMSHKSHARKLLQDFCAYVQTQFNVCIKTIRSDNGP